VNALVLVELVEAVLGEPWMAFVLMCCWDLGVDVSDGVLKCTERTLTIFVSFSNRSTSAFEKLLMPIAFVLPFFWHSSIAL
jgi:hypothetical protein